MFPGSLFPLFPILFILLYIGGIVLVILAIVRFLRLQQKRIDIEQERNEIFKRILDKLPGAKGNTGL